ncbi:MAG TPA: response regulator transcription factor [Micromonosporaceae bacterium]
MTAAPVAATDIRVPVRVVSPDATKADRTATILRRAGIPATVRCEHRSAGALVVAVADTVDAAIDACRPAVPALLVADRFSRTGVRRAVRLGVRALLRTADLDSIRLVNAVRAAGHGDGRIPHALLVRLLTGGDDPDPMPTGAVPLTPRQTTVLALMAEGYDNCAIARKLGCSEHTVKNVIYELMHRLQARNRAHAVAYAVRTGLI